MTTPVRYAPNVETPAADEAETFAALTAAMQTISAITFKDEGRAIRAVHAKSQGLLTGELEVLDGLPPELAQGLFTTPARYRATVRLSTSPGDLIDDAISTPRGVSLKIHGVPGQQLSGNPADNTQDFLMIDGPVFAASNPKGFLGTVKLLAGTTDRAEGLKKVLSYVLQGLESAVEAVGGKSGTLIGLGGHPETNPLGATYFTQVPMRYGDYIAKLSLAPVGPELTALTDAKVDLSGKPDGLRLAVSDHFATSGGTWELRVQLNTNLETMPVEDAAKEWSQADSPYLAVARLTVAPQTSWDAAQVAAIDDGAAFSPWHGLVAHQPLGGVMRARKSVYAALQDERSQRSGCPFSQG